MGKVNRTKSKKVMKVLTDKRKIVLKGRVPSKKNSKRRIKRGNHIFMVPSEAHEVWHREQSYFLKQNWKHGMVHPAHLEICFYAGDKRKADLSNKAESIMDLLVDCGVIEDDNWFVIPGLTLTFMGLDKENPRAEIYFY